MRYFRAGWLRALPQREPNLLLPLWPAKLTHAAQPRGLPACDRGSRLAYHYAEVRLRLACECLVPPSTGSERVGGLGEGVSDGQQSVMAMPPISPRTELRLSLLP